MLLRGVSPYLVSKPIDQKHKRLDYRKSIFLCPYLFNTNIAVILFCLQKNPNRSSYLSEIIPESYSFHAWYAMSIFHKYTLNCGNASAWYIHDYIRFVFRFILILFDCGLVTFLRTISFYSPYNLSISYPRTCMYFFLMPHTLCTTTVIVKCRIQTKFPNEIKRICTV